LLTLVRDGGNFGERALLLQAPRAASAAARTFAEILCLPHDDFHEMLQQHPAFAQELRRMTEKTFGITHDSGASRSSSSDMPEKRPSGFALGR